jgi:hypothetical protein
MAKKNKPGEIRRQRNRILNRERRQQLAIQAGKAFLADPAHKEKLANVGTGKLGEICDRLGFPNVDTMCFVLRQLWKRETNNET